MIPRTDAVLLVGCVKTKASEPAMAKDLYVSPLWSKRRGYAEASGMPWAILSAKYGLVQPEEAVSPYELALASLAMPERREWGRKVVTQVTEWLGSLRAVTFEIHAGAHYRDALRPGLTEQGAVMREPLRGLPLGAQLAWYRRGARPLRRQMATDAEVERALNALDGSPIKIPANDWQVGLGDLGQPGLYSWWVDDDGAAALTKGIGLSVLPGRIYAGQTGATKWPSGTTGKNTLRKRISQHIRGRIRGSTFRLTLAAALATPLGLERTGPKMLAPPSEQAVTAWIRDHLCVAVHPFADPDPLDDLEHRVLAVLDPPLNLGKVPPTPTRGRISALRATLS